METKTQFISVDDHVVEHPEVWTQRLSKTRWGGRIPHTERQADGSEHWVVDGRMYPLTGVASVGAAMSDRNHEPRRWEEVPQVAYSPTERLKAMDADGVDCSVLYPTVAGLAGETFGCIEDSELELACVEAYNDWLIEEWSSQSDRFIPQCIVPLFPVEATVKEIKRAVAKGHRGVVFPSVPMELRDLPHLNDSIYDPIWSTCQELEVPLCLHAGASRKIQIAPHEGYTPKLAGAFQAITRSASSISILVDFLISRILTRHPRLKVVFAESTLGWGPYLLEYVDHQAREDGLANEGFHLKPSEMFKGQCYLVGWYDRAGIRSRRFIGTENMMWSTNFPMATSTWPSSQDYIARSFEGVPDQDRRKILYENAASLYKISNGKG